MDEGTGAEWVANLETAVIGAVTGLAAVLVFVTHIIRRIDKLVGRTAVIERDLEEHKNVTAKAVESMADATRQIGAQIATININLATHMASQLKQADLEHFVNRIEYAMLDNRNGMEDRKG